MGKRGPEKRFEERRPRKARGARLHIVISAALMARLRKAAAASGQTVSEYVRGLIERAMPPRM